MWRQSITFRLTVFFALTSSAIHLAVSAVIGYQVETHFRTIDAHSLTGKMVMVRHALSTVREKAQLDELPRHLGDSLIGHKGLSVAVVGSDGKVLVNSADLEVPRDLNELVNGSTAAEPVTWTHAGHKFRVYAARASTGIPDMAPLTVAISLDIDEHARFMSKFRAILFYSVTGGILLTGLLGWFVARRGLSPVRTIARVAAGISANRLRNRLPLDEVPTELRDLAGSFNDMLARLDDSFRRLSEYSADLAHELRTPISSLTTQTQVALSRARTADEYREILYANLEEYERLTRMISDMLFIAKADNKLITPNREQVSLGAEIDKIIDFYQALAEEKLVTISRTGEGSIMGDRLMLRRALGNLLSNAVRHVPDGGKIVISVDSAGASGTTIAVENSGKDIPPEHLPRLFDRFYRADSSRLRNGDGTGLGLAIAKSIVVAHGGQLGVTSTGGLTRFGVTLPSA